MKTFGIYKTWGCYSIKEIEDMVKDYKDNYDPEELEGLSDDDIEERCTELINNDYFDDDFGRHGNVTYCEALMKYPCIISGSLGLWDGRHTIQNVETKNILDAVFKCCGECDDVEIFESVRGQLYVNAHHHDGTNKFMIQFKTPKGNRAVHFRKVLCGVGN